jgi:hypothetical protein
MLASLFTLALAASAYAAPSSVARTVSPDPSQVYIKGITYGGTGCPQGSLSSFISADRQTFTLIFDQYVASIGPKVAITENRKNCQLNIDLQYPSGFQYSVFNTVYRGYVDLDDGVTARQQSTFYFSGQSAQTSTGTNFKGPRTGDYTLSDQLGLSSVVWSPCGSPKALNLNSEVRLNSSKTGASGLITDDSIDGKVTFIVGVQWQNC